MFYKKGVLFTKFTGKQLGQSLFFNKGTGVNLQLYQKRDFDTAAFLWILLNFQEHFFLQNVCGGCLVFGSNYDLEKSRYMDQVNCLFFYVVVNQNWFLIFRPKKILLSSLSDTWHDIGHEVV